MKRKLSWILAAIAYGSPLWAWREIVLDQEAQRAAYGFVKCGNPMIGIVLFTSLICTGAAVVALGLNTAAFLQIARPRPKLRLAEIAVVALPLAPALFVVGSILWL